MPLLEFRFISLDYLFAPDGTLKEDLQDYVIAGIALLPGQRPVSITSLIYCSL